MSSRRRSSSSAATRPATRTFLSFIFLVSYILTKASVTIFAGAFAIQTILGYESRQSAVARRDGLLLVRRVLPGDHHRRVRGARRHEVGAVDRSHARAGAARRFDRAAVRRSRRDRWSRCAARPPIPRRFTCGGRCRPRPRRRAFRGSCSTRATLRGSACCCAHRSSGSGTGARINTSCSACSPLAACKEARRGTIFAAYLKLAPVFIFLLPGMIAVALYKQGFPGFEGIGENPQSAFPVLVSNLLPVGLRGLVLAGMLSALMSALASLFNSTATLFTVDFYKRLKPQSSEQHLVTVGRVATVGVDRARHVVDSVPAGPWQGPALHLPAARAVVVRPVDCRRVHARNLRARRDAEVRPDTASWRDS